MICSGGRSNKNALGSVVWSIGQPAIVKNATIVQGTTFSISQGFHKPEIQKKSNTYGVSIYPNPFSSEIILRISNFKEDLFCYSINDISGKELIGSTALTEEKQFISMTNFSAGSYFLKVMAKNGRTECHVIIKSNE